MGGGRTTARVSAADRKPPSQACAQAAFLPSWQLGLAQQHAGVFVFFPQQPPLPLAHTRFWLRGGRCWVEHREAETWFLIGLYLLLPV